MPQSRPPKGVKVSTVSRTASDLERAFYGSLINQLATARRQRSLSQSDLDALLGVSDGMVGKWESFARMPSAFMLMCWLSALNVQLLIGFAPSRRLAKPCAHAKAHPITIPHKEPAP